MASFSQMSLVLSISIALLIVSPVQSETCKSQKKHYADCKDLPVLSAKLFWTYTAANNTLSVAFTAPPPNPNGWVAWSINPTGTKMAGAQAFVAARLPNGSVPVSTYNISSYGSIVPGKLSFDVLDTSAEFSGGSITIFAVVKPPALTSGSLNHVWQVGPGFNASNGWLLKHDFAPANLAAFGPLKVVSSGPSISVSPSGSPSASPTSSPSSSSAVSPSPGSDSSSPSNGKNGVGSVTISFGNLVLCALISLLVVLVNL